MFRDDECLSSRIETISEFPDLKWIHLDIADGVFTYHKTWNDPESWQKSTSVTKTEVHLMVSKPQDVVLAWINAGASRIAIQVETLTEKTYKDIIGLTNKHEVELMLAMNPETSLCEALSYGRDTSRFLILGVHPGLSGQRFLPLILKKVSVLRELMPSAFIEVDGGIDIATGRLALDAGADALVSDSAIFNSESPIESYGKLCTL